MLDCSVGRICKLSLQEPIQYITGNPHNILTLYGYQHLAQIMYESRYTIVSKRFFGNFNSVSCMQRGGKMSAKVYQGTVEILLQNDTFVSEFLQGIRSRDLSRLIDEGIYAKLFIADTYRNVRGDSVPTKERLRVR